VTSWHEILNEYAERVHAAVSVHPTIYVSPEVYKTAIEVGHRPEDLTLVTPGGQYEDSLAAYIATELPRRYHQLMEPYWHALIEGDMTGEPLGFLGQDRQETDLTRDGAGGSYVQISGENGKVRYEGPAPWEPQQPNDMRPRVVNRAKVKAARKVARVNRRKRGKR
jgi:hypothetical protein